MMRKISLILISIIMIAFIFSCAGSNVPKIVEIKSAGWNPDVSTGDFSNTNGTLKLAADGTLEYVRDNGNLGATGIWGEAKGALAVQFNTLHDLDGENPYEETVRYDYGEGYADGSTFALINASGASSSLEGSWTLPNIKRYDMGREGGIFVALDVDMTWTFTADMLTITYNSYKEYNEDSPELGEPLYVGDGETEEIPYTVEGNLIKLDYEPVVNIFYAGGRLGDPTMIDFEIKDGMLLLYAFTK